MTGQLATLYGCRHCYKKCQFNDHVAPKLRDDKVFSTMHGKVKMYPCSTKPRGKWWRND